MILLPPGLSQRQHILEIVMFVDLLAIRSSRELVIYSCVQRSKINYGNSKMYVVLLWPWQGHSNTT